MKLFVEEVRTSLYQTITVGSKPLQLAAIRPHLMRWLAPAGSLTVQIWDGNRNLVETSPSMTIASLGSGNYWHGYQRFYMNSFLRAGTVYRIAVVASGYTFSESAYFGWVNAYDLRKAPSTFTPNAGANAEFDLELWESKEASMGVG